MAKYASKIVALAQSWIGKKESDGTHKSIIDIYNAHRPLARNYKVKYTDEWCATTISALAIKLGYTDIIPTECSCQKMIALFQNIGAWAENENRTPKAGDIIFYDWQDNGVGDNKGWSDHVGIVEKVSGNKITIIEGNNSCAVKRRTLEVNARYIRGYGVPKYDAEQSAPVAQPSTSTPGAYTGNSIVEYLKSIGKPSDFASRKQYAAQYGISGYRGTAAQNIKLLNLMRGGASVQTSAYYPKYTGSSYGIDTVFAAIGVPASMRGNWKNRKTIAKANGISNYTGTASQNTKLITLAKQGKLKKA